MGDQEVISGLGFFDNLDVIENEYTHGGAQVLLCDLNHGFLGSWDFEFATAGRKPGSEADFKSQECRKRTDQFRIKEIFRKKEIGDSRRSISIAREGELRPR